jgi:hypothetical protein
MPTRDTKGPKKNKEKENQSTYISFFSNIYQIISIFEITNVFRNRIRGF